ncbi:hypothetical protein [Brevundimonas sp.]|uniref:hypothetical protein n=1 Tax=Brevundimonas sp. TaxID=1871086 RepID=UPI0028AA19C6|nr:hypothetical protein [Brevundimonas sp.]
MTQIPHPHFRPHPTEGVPGRDWFYPLSGWLLSALVSLDEDAPGTLLFAIKSKSLWRNAVAVALATGALDHPKTFLLRAYGNLDEDRAESDRAQFALAIQKMKPQQIVEAALGEVPPSLCGSLRKIGWEPLSTPDGYRRLIEMLGSKTAEGRTRRRVLEQINDCRLTDDPVLQTVQILDLAILSPTVVSQISSTAECHRLNARLGLIRKMCSTASDAALKASADALGSRFNAGQFVRSWLGKADRLEPLGLPIDHAPGIIRISPQQAEKWGRRYRNCLSGYSHEMAAGALAFFVIESLAVIVVLRLTDAGWMLNGVYTHANGRVSRDVLQAVKESLTQLGVLCIIPARPKGDIALVSGAFSRVDDLEFRWEGMDEFG